MKTISREEYLAAFALFAMAAEHQRRCREFEEAYCRRLGVDFGMGKVSDILYEGSTTSEAFTDALAADGITVSADDIKQVSDADR